jgi:hypothetical protein
MHNVTISMDEETARWLRVEAAKAGKSVSRFVGDLLAERRASRTGEVAAALQGQKEAMEAFLSVPARALGFRGRAPSREEIYDEVLHRHEHTAVREGHDGPSQAKAGKGMAHQTQRAQSRGAKRSKPS